METFEDWLKHYFTRYELENEIGGESLQNLGDIWNHQQRKVLEARNLAQRHLDQINLLLNLLRDKPLEKIKWE